MHNFLKEITYYKWKLVYEPIFYSYYNYIKIDFPLDHLKIRYLKRSYSKMQTGTQIPNQQVFSSITL